MSTPSPKIYTIVCDSKTKRPLCALLQAFFNGGHDYSAIHFMDSKTWIISPHNIDPVRVPGTQAEWTAHGIKLMKALK